VKIDTSVLMAAGLAAALLLPRLLRGRRAAPEIVRERLARGATVIDVRTPAEFRGGAYPGAINLPLGELSARVSEIRRDRPVVLYCRSGSRSGMAAAQLRNLGFTDVVNAGGLGSMPR
jgi:phage shock protein E